MKQVKVVKILAVLAVLLIIFSVGVTFADNSPTLNSPNDSVKVLPAETFWEKTYGGAADDRAFSSIPVSNGDFLIVGSSKSIVQGKIVGWALEINRNGNAVWNQMYLAGNGTELRFAVNLTDGFLLVGNEFLAPGNINGFVAKINFKGVLMWNITLGGEKIDKLFSATQTSNGFVLCGLTYSFGSDDSKAWIVKIDFNGNLVWDKTFGGSTEDALRTCVLCPDGNILAAGYTADVQEPSNYNFLLIKVDSSGELLWNKTFSGKESQKAYAMAKTADGVIIVGDGFSNKTDIDAFLVKVDFDGNLIWTKTVGGKNADSPASIVPSKDGGFLIVGFTFSFGQGNRDFWLFKIDSSGKVLWSCTCGDAGYQEAYSVIEIEQNRFIMVGWADPQGIPDLIGKATYNFYAVAIGPNSGNNAFFGLKLVVWAVTIAVSAALLVFGTKMYLQKRKMKN